MSGLNVWKRLKPTGELKKPALREYSFTYNEGADSPISYSMPIAAQAYLSRTLHPVFQSLLPEGALLAEVTRHMELSLNRDVDDIDILEAVGNNSLGAISFSKEPSPLPRGGVFSLSTINQADDEFSAFNMALRDFFLSGVAGVQPKFLARSLSTGSLIVKSYDPYEYPALAVVEQVCMEIAGNIGVDVAKTSLSRQGNVLFVERFDVQDNKFKDMEELCSIMGNGTSEKYEGSYEQVAKILATIDPESLSSLFKQLVFHCIIRNGDAHSKNFAVLDGRLSPMYDAVCTRAWIPGDLMALQMNGTKRWPNDTDLIAFGVARCRMKPSEAKSTLKAMRDGALSSLGIVAAYAARYQDVRHIESVLSNLNEHILNGCGQKTGNELSLHSIPKLIAQDKLRQTFKDGVQLSGTDWGM